MIDHFISVAVAETSLYSINDPHSGIEESEQTPSLAAQCSNRTSLSIDQLECREPSNRALLCIRLYTLCKIKFVGELDRIGAYLTEDASLGSKISQKRLGGVLLCLGHGNSQGNIRMGHAW